MKSAWIASLVVLAAAQQAVGQTDSQLYRYHYKTKVPLFASSSEVAVRRADGKSLEALSASLQAAGIASDKVAPHAVERWTIATLPQAQRSLDGAKAMVSRLAKDAAVEFVSPVLLDEEGNPAMITRDILVRFRPEVEPADAERILAEANIGTIEERDWADMPGAYRLISRSKSALATLDAVNRLTERDEIRYAETDMVLTATADMLPNDPGFPDSWGLHNTGQAGGVPDMDMDAPEAWDISTGVPSVIVAVFDVGVQPDHPDLNFAMGSDFTGENSPNGGPVNVCDNHGTAVAGCISARVNNSLGSAGSAPGCRVASARIGINTINNPCNSLWNLQASWIVNGLTWAQTNGARVTNHSYGFGAGFASSSLEDKFEQTRNAGMVHFGSAGNGGSDGIGDPVLGYPSLIASVNSVAALDRNGDLTTFSNYGPGLALSAPGRNIYTTDRTSSAGYTANDYLPTFSGTSAASPYAAGVAALVLSVNPSFTSEQVERILKFSSMDLGTTGYDTRYGWGFINARRALELATTDCNGNGGLDILETIRPVTFAARSDFASGYGAVAMEAADLDGDADVDVALSTLGVIKVLKNNGNGTFAAPVDNSANGGPWALAIADVDNDTDKDIVVANAFSNDASVLRNNGDGTFAAAVNYASAASGNPSGIALANLNADTLPDIIVANAATGNVSVLMNLGGGAFAVQVAYASGANSRTIAAGDYDGDGDIDLAVGRGSTSGISILKNNGSGVFTAPVAYATRQDPRMVAAADLNADGKLDLIAGLEAGNGVSVLFGYGDATFTQEEFYTTAAAVHSIAIGDVDNDGRPDIASANRNADTLSVLRNQRDGYFAMPTTLTAGNGPWPVVIDDFDGDGKKDIISGQWDTGGVSLFKNATPAVGTATQAVPSGTLGLPIPDNNTTGVSHTMNVSQSGAIVDLDVKINITHTYVGDLTITLTHNATTITLVARRGGSGDNFANTVFDDEAATAITAITPAMAPYSASFRPEQALSVFDGMDRNGAWTIKVVDGANLDVGTLVNWTLLFNSPGGADANYNGIPDSCEPPTTGDMNCDGVVNLGDVGPFCQAMTDLAGYQLTYPSCDPMHGDMNVDLVLDSRDMQGFVNRLMTP